MKRVFQKFVQSFVLVIIFLGMAFTHTAFAEECTVTTAFVPFATVDVSQTGRTPGVLQDFYKGTGKQRIKIRITPNKVPNDATGTPNPECLNKKIYLTIFAKNGGSGVYGDNVRPLSGVIDKEFIIQNLEGAEQWFKVGEEACYDHKISDLKEFVSKEIKKGANPADLLQSFKIPAGSKLGDYLFESHISGLKNPTLLKIDDYWMAKSIMREIYGASDCEYFARASVIKLADDPLRKQYKLLVTASDYMTGNHYGFMCNITDGNVFYQNTNSSGNAGEKSFPVSSVLESKKADFTTCDSGSWSPAGAASVGLDQSIDTTDPCIDANGNQKNDCYELLAPIPGMGDIIHFEGTQPTATDPGTPPFDLFVLFSKLLTITLGSLSVIAVIMLVYIGSQYIISSKSGDVSKLLALRSRLVGVITGIGIILGSYIILNTINPDLLRMDATLEDVVLPYQEGDAGNRGIGAGSIPTSSTKSVECPMGIVPVKHGLGTTYVCKSIASDMEKLFRDAQSAGVPISGDGWRSSETQIQLRKKYCNGDITNPKALCKPPVAVPGSSMHENGYAIDFSCKDDVPNTGLSKKCFDWLTANAAKYGLKNFPKENWHWSINGQ